MLDFMKQYGYLKADKENSAALYTEDGLSEAIKTVQRFGALKETGRLDNATLKLMSSPRCGNPDVLHGKRSKRFVLANGWNKRHLTYHVANWPYKLGEEAVARLIGKALKTWGDYGRLEFTRKPTPDADIIVSFARGYHNDMFPFDGPGYVLAHAFFPNPGSDIAGDIHFDLDEDWVEAKPQEFLESGTDFYSVALHELGHSLGLAHSTDENSIMFPYYKGTDGTSVQLGQDDLMAMYQLYILRSIQEPTTESTRRTKPPNTRSPTTRTRPREPATRTTQRETTRLYTENKRTYSWRTTEPTVSTRAPPNRPTYTNSMTPSTRYPTTRTRSTTYTRRTTYTTPTPSTFYPTTSTRREWITKETSASRWHTITPPSRRDHTSSFGTSTSNSRYGSTGRGTTSHESSATVNRRPYSPSWYPIGSQSSTPPPEPNICQGKFDAVANLRGEIFIFKDEYIWRLQDLNRRVSGYPVLMRHMFQYLPENIKKIDAAYQRSDGNMILFTGDLYWVYDGTNFIENSPRSLMDYGIPQGIGGIDAIQTWDRNGKTYLYKGDRFWRFNETSKTIDPGYPQPIEKWGGIPSNIDAALSWKDGKTYFFKDDLYWILNNRDGITSDSPRSSTREWLGCP
ncbi:matrix metalloproteinase-17-like isoform X2 [Harmonia axyridis]|uniref:matrix metalloproteinase-17-like isoform X2 n=1 Tax=Harmonia axyridis TaxID=115357 RepID=UPI001E279BDE|nr:matrix metalloproteinase-17-like isoform X2 [Harmonia axyridis]XP_045475030.1 matrix metalloproteinase-17-like isoform X2 [Harmonia axyridis]